MVSDEKRARLINVRQQLNDVATKVTSAHVNIRNRLRRLRQQVPKHRAIQHRLGALKARAEAISKLRERVMARRASVRPLRETIRSFSIEPVPGKPERAAPMVVSHPSDDIDRPPVSSNIAPKDMSPALENDTQMQANGEADAAANSAGSQSAAKSSGKVGNSAAPRNTASSAKDKSSGVSPMPKANDSSTDSLGESNNADKSDRNVDGAPTTDRVKLGDDGGTIPQPLLDENPREPVMKVPQSPSHTDKVAGQSHTDLQAKAGVAPAVPRAVTSLACPDNSVAPLPKSEDRKPKDGRTSDPAEAPAEILRPPTDEHDLLILRFKTAHNDKERRDVAVLIRADKRALERMVLLKDPDWIAVQQQYNNQQQIAGRAGGIGGG